MSVIFSLNNIKDNDHIHIVDKTGFCKECDTTVETKNIQGNNYNKIEKMFESSKDDIIGIYDNKINIKINKEKNYIRKVLRYKRYKCFDFCDGNLSKKYRYCEFLETICYFPLWCIMFSIITLIASVAVIGYLSFYYSNSISIIKSYSEYCDATNICNGDKGLVCKMNTSKGIYEESCNCPSLGVVNTCDCSSSHYWDGLNCAPVYSYGEGDCSGDYSCQKGLHCDDYSAKCLCPDYKPEWNSKLKQCEYKYMGCYNYTGNVNLTYDFTLSEIYYQTRIYNLEIDDCIDVCKVLNKKYAHMVYNGNNLCACSNSYNMYSTTVDDYYCNFPCLYLNSIGTNRCPKNYQYSSFQIA